MSIGERITELRTEQNISQAQLAKALDVTRQAVSKWENDLTAPDTIKLIQLADLLDTDVEYLATGRKSYGRRPPVVIKTVETVEKVVEKPVVKIVEKPVEKPVIQYRDRPVVQYVEKTSDQTGGTHKICKKSHRVCNRRTGLFCSGTVLGKHHILRGVRIAYSPSLFDHHSAVSIASRRFLTRYTASPSGISNLSAPFLGIIHFLNPSLATSARR